MTLPIRPPIIVHHADKPLAVTNAKRLRAAGVDQFTTNTPWRLLHSCPDEAYAYVLSSGSGRNTGCS
jgi:hypothetical protein